MCGSSTVPCLIHLCCHFEGAFKKMPRGGHGGGGGGADNKSSVDQGSVLVIYTPSQK